MDVIEFHVCRQDSDLCWVVELDSATYGAYLDKEQALLDAVDAAKDARQSGREAQVFLREHLVAARIF
jgi:hypothetical protein